MKKFVVFFVFAIFSLSFAQGQDQKFLKPIIGGEKMTIEPTSGKEKASDKDVFTATDQNFKNWSLDQGAPSTEAASLAVFSLNGEASFDEVFKTDADKEKVALTVPQFRKMASKYPDILKDGSIYVIIKASGKFYTVQTTVKESGLNLETWQTGDYLSFGSRDKFVAASK